MIGSMNAYAGFFVPVQDLPWPWKILYYINPARFGIQSLATPQFWCSQSCLHAEDDGSQFPEIGGSASISYLGDSNGQPFVQGCLTPVDANGDVDFVNGSVNPDILILNGASGPGCRLMSDPVWALPENVNQYAGSENVSNSELVPLVTQWDQYFTQTEVKYEDGNYALVAMIGIAVLFKIATFLCLKYLKHMNR